MVKISDKLKDLPHLPLSSLVELQGNLKDLSTANYNKLKKSITENGIIVPFFVWQSPDGNKLLDGHQRKRVLTKEGYKGNVPVVYIEADSLQDAKKKLLVISSQYGRITQEGYDEFTFDLPEDWLEETVHFDALGFVFINDEDDTPQELNDSEPQTSRADELRQEWQTETGQLWILPSRDGKGEHRLIVGDCTDREVVERVMGGERAEMAFTSPPYLNMRDYSGNDLSLDTLLGFVSASSRLWNYFVVNLGLKFDDGEVSRYWDSYITRFNDCGYSLLAWNVWDKTMGGSIASATNMFLLTHEWLLVFGEGRKRLNRTVPNQLDKYERRHGAGFLEKGTKKGVRQANGTFEKTTSAAYTHHQLHSVIQQTPELGSVRENHPAIMPVGLPTRYAEAMTEPGEIVYDPFAGSGTTLIACENLNRYCRAVEISPSYSAVILQRYFDTFQIRPYLELVK